MVKSTSSEDLEAWLKDKPADFAQVIAARAALRVLPYAFGRAIPRENVDDWVASNSVAFFRAAAISWAARNVPAYNMAFAALRAARVVNIFVSDFHIAIDALDDPDVSILNHPRSDVACAARAAAHSAYDLAHIKAHAVDAVDYATTAAAYATVYVYTDLWININYDCDRLTSVRDLTWDSRSLTHEKLWPAGEPEGWREAWVSAIGRLAALNEGYQVWIDWYNRRIEGHDAAFDIPGDTDRTEDKAILARLADATDEDFWNKGAAYVNATLQSWIDEARFQGKLRSEEAQPEEPPTTPTDPPPAAPASIPPQNQNALPFSSTEDGKLRIDQSRSADALRTDADAQDRHAEAIREARALLDRCRLSNSAARLVVALENYLAAGGETLADLRPSLFVQRGEKLRQEIAAYESGQQDGFLEPIADDLLIDLKGWRSAHNMAVGLDPVLMRLDTATLGPDVKPALIAPDELRDFVAAADKADILEEGVRPILDEAINLAPDVPDANDRRTIWSIESVQNLVIEAFSVALTHPVSVAVAGAGVAVAAKLGVTVGMAELAGAAGFLYTQRQWVETKLANSPTWKSLFIQLCDKAEKELRAMRKSGDDKG